MAIHVSMAHEYSSLQMTLTHEHSDFFGGNEFKGYCVPLTQNRKRYKNITIFTLNGIETQLPFFFVLVFCFIYNWHCGSSL